MNLTPAELALLLFLHRREAALHIAVVLPVHETLAERGYVTLKSQDRGGTLVDLTTAGRAALADAGVRAPEASSFEGF